MAFVMDMFQKPIKYIAGIARGFIVRPTNSSGEISGDLVNVDNQIWEANVNHLLGPKAVRDEIGETLYFGNEWKSVRNPKYQEVGNIDWKGPWKTNKQEKRKIVSVRGPQLRYWNTNGKFNYGDNESHNEIYMDGKIIGIAPSPVLAAALAYETLSTGEKKELLIAVCVEGENDVVYVRHELCSLKFPVPEETRHQQKQKDVMLIDFYLSHGWVEIGRGNGFKLENVSSVFPEAPWFFNDQGIWAKTMRRVKYKHSDNRYPFSSISYYDDELYIELDLNINVTTKKATFSVAENWDELKQYNKWTYTETINKWQKTYVQPAVESSDGYSHSFLETFVNTEFSVVGQSKMCVDFSVKHNCWLYGWITGQQYRGHNQLWTEGTDSNSHPHPNTGSAAGPQPLPDPYIPPLELPQSSISFNFFNWHYQESWHGIWEWANFQIGKSNVTPIPEFADIALCWGKSGDKSVQAGGEPDPTNPFFAFWDSYDTWLHYVDIRESLFCGYVLFNNASVDTEGSGLWTVTEENLEWASLAEIPENYTLGKPEDVVTEDRWENYIFMRHSVFPANTTALWPFGITYEDMQLIATPTEFTYTAYNYSYSRCISNEDSTYQKYHVWHSYTGWINTVMTNPKWKKINLIEMLSNQEKTYRLGVFGTTEKEETLISMVYYDPTQKAIVAKAKSWGIEVSIQTTTYLNNQPVTTTLVFDQNPLAALSYGDRITYGGVF